MTYASRRPPCWATHRRWLYAALVSDGRILGADRPEAQGVVAGGVVTYRVQPQGCGSSADGSRLGLLHLGPEVGRPGSHDRVPAAQHGLAGRAVGRLAHETAGRKADRLLHYLIPLGRLGTDRPKAQGVVAGGVVAHRVQPQGCGSSADGSRLGLLHLGPE